MNNSQRASGVLMPIFSLPSKYGIGTFGKEAYNFVDALKTAKQKYWQILPLCPTSYGDSPYQSFSTFAGNPYFIDLEMLIEEGCLTKKQCDAVDFGEKDDSIDYFKMYNARYELLREAYQKSNYKNTNDYARFTKRNSYWLFNYCLFMALKKHFNNITWLEWDDDIKHRNHSAINKYKKELSDEINFQSFMQFYFSKQWSALKNYTNKKGIKIIGDLPIYVAMDSADAWADPHLFMFDENLKPQTVAGVPPDYFSAYGQLWGNPIYNWQNHKKTNYDWWVKRLSHVSKLYDTVRIDHFRGFAEYWAVPFGERTAKKGNWEKGPGFDLFKEIKNKLGDIDIIAEDLGVTSKGLEKLMAKCEYPGMKILQFAFSKWQDSNYLPHNYTKNCVVYTGTHDNTTTLQWFNDLKMTDKHFVTEYCRVNVKNPVYDIIETAFSSVANLVIIPMQDYLIMNGNARINTPSTLGFNWQWRLKKCQFNKKLQLKIALITETYFRNNRALLIKKGNVKNEQSKNN